MARAPVAAVAVAFPNIARLLSAVWKLEAKYCEAIWEGEGEGARARARQPPTASFAPAQSFKLPAASGVKCGSLQPFKLQCSAIMGRNGALLEGVGVTKTISMRRRTRKLDIPGNSAEIIPF